jgi:hypothetical protein
MKIHSFSSFTIVEFMKIHLDVLENPVTIGDGRSIWSCLIGILRDARKATGRDSKTGVLPQKHAEWNGGDPGSWMGAIAYMTAIDQLGSAYGPKANNSTRWPGVLVDFGGLSERDAQVLYKLRCCLVHEASLIDESAKLAFEVSGSGQPLIVEATDVWDGVLDTLSGSHATRVDLRKFGDVVEACLVEYQKRLQCGKLMTRYSQKQFSKKFIFGTKLGAVIA